MELLPRSPRQRVFIDGLRVVRNHAPTPHPDRVRIRSTLCSGGISDPATVTRSCCRPYVPRRTQEARDLVEAAPTTVKDGVIKEDAEKMKEKLEVAGACVDIK